MTLEDLKKLNRPYELQKRFHDHWKRYFDASKTARAFLAAECEMRAYNAQECNVSTFNSFD